MRKANSWKARSAAASLASAVLILALGLLSQEPGQRPSPISFHLMRGSILEKTVAAKIEKDNALLAMALADLRGKGPGDLPKLIPAWNEKFQGTYLNQPQLIGEDKGALSGWEAVLPALLGIVNESTYVDVQDVRVGLEYVPYDAKKKPAGMDDIDFRITIRTSLGCALGDPILEGSYCHRRPCVLMPGTCVGI